MITNLTIKLFWKFQAGNWCRFLDWKSLQVLSINVWTNDLFNKKEIKYNLRDSSRVEQPLCSMTRYGLNSIAYQGASYGTLCHTISRIISISSLSKAWFSPGMVLYVIVVSVYYVNFNHTKSCHHNFIMCMNVFSCLWHQGLTIYVPRTAHNPPSHPHPHHYHLHFLHFHLYISLHFSIILSVSSSAS